MFFSPGHGRFAADRCRAYARLPMRPQSFPLPDKFLCIAEVTGFRRAKNRRDAIDLDVERRDPFHDSNTAETSSLR